jgi:hypothetical protein
MTNIAKKYPLDIKDLLPIIKKLPILHQDLSRVNNITLNGNYVTQNNFRGNSGFIVRNHAVPSRHSPILSDISQCKFNPKEYLGSNKNLIKETINNPYIPVDGRSKSAIRNAKHTLNVIGVTFIH